jgi:hypothetical protein
MMVVGHVLVVVVVVPDDDVLLIQRVVSSSRGVSVGNNIDERWLFWGVVVTVRVLIEEVWWWI